MSVPSWATTSVGGADVVIKSSCTIADGGFVDVDADGVDDLVIQLGSRVYAWPTSAKQADPSEWGLPNSVEYGDGWARLASGSDGWPGQLHWAYAESDGTYRSTEYAVSTDTLTLDEGWSEVGETLFYYYLGDVDGDGSADLAHRGGYRLSSTGQWVDKPAVWFDDSGYRYSALEQWGVGDINHDGFDDAVIGWRAADLDYYYKCSYEWGPVALYFGSPVGLELEPIWLLWAPAGGLLAVGEQAVGVPEQDAIIVTMAAESGMCTDWTPLSLAVIRNASTPDAFIDQVVETPEFGTGDVYYNYLFGMLSGPGGSMDLAVLDATGLAQGIQWFSWDPNASLLTGSPVASWETELPFSLYFSFLSIPDGRRSQALVFARAAESGPDELLVWGRSVDDVGPSRSGSVAGDCTLWAVEPGTPTDGPTESPPGSTTSHDTGEPLVFEDPSRHVGTTDVSCGCRALGAGPWDVLGPLGAAFLGWLSRGRGRHCRREGGLVPMDRNRAVV